jgi:2'-5' RNA ligase
MPRRVFVALPVSAELQAEVSRWTGRHRGLPVRWITGNNLHVTLVPPWAEENVERVRAALQTLEGSFGAFPLAFTRVRYGPTSRTPRLIWAEGEAPEQMFILKHALERTLAITPEGKTLLLHLTLARFRPEEFSSFPEQKLDDPLDWRETASSFVLMESRLARSGATYETLAAFPL